MTTPRIRLAALAITASLILVPLTSAVAEVISVPVGSQAERSQISVPDTGMSQASVRAKWGEPMTIEGPVGQPPISQWHYQRFVVYFENDRVLHTVIKPRR
ncbi:MAG TPA: hypothetical protein VFN01_03195 [Marinobacter sp.]|uniref:hypothetical protein n=1 Tax=Marinobacter sp. TaxID=50741 RepID=UPI002D7EA482|nr:hypothetical protein [Marinobacter sp.]HET8800167.1 hypothetical protein [Marinobacter sp.]